MRSVEFALGLFGDAGTVGIAAEDLDGPHGELLRRWQDQGFIGRVPLRHPCPSCPYCEGGVPYRVNERLLCNHCGSMLDPRCLSLWPLHRDVFLAAIAGHLRLRGGVQRFDETLWQLGTGATEGDAVECFYCPSGLPSEQAERKLAVYRRLLVLHGPSAAPDRPGHARWVPLPLLFRPDGSFADGDLATLLRPRGAVQFDAHGGTLWVGGVLMGEVPVGGREFHLLECLAEQLDAYVPYGDLKREVLRRSGGRDETDEATFCHGLKKRLKKRWIAGIDRLVVTTNKGDGYRLRGFVADG